MKRILIVGAGAMAREYAKILRDLRVDFDVLCRRQETAKQFLADIGVLPKTDALDVCCKNGGYDYAIVATTVETLPNLALQLAQNGVKNILLEKPGAVDFSSLSILRQAEQHGANIYIAYNRRFYSSVKKAKELIDEDGGVTSCFFDFTEWSHVIEKVDKSEFTKKNWFFANSTHVIDLVFNIIGLPRDIQCFSANKLIWHDFPALYVGSGVSEKDVYFSYHANWNSPGRWSIEINTKNHKLVFKPLEKLKIQSKGSVEELFVDIDDTIDQRFKPGLHAQVVEFILSKNKSALCSLNYLEKELHIFNKIVGV